MNWPLLPLIAVKTRAPLFSWKEFALGYFSYQMQFLLLFFNINILVNSHSTFRRNGFPRVITIKVGFGTHHTLHLYSRHGGSLQCNLPFSLYQRNDINSNCYNHFSWCTNYFVCFATLSTSGWYHPLNILV